MTGILLFIFGAVIGGVIEMAIQHPFEDVVEKRFQQMLHTGVYRKLYFQTVDYAQLRKKLISAIDKYDFDYAKILMKQLEWFIEEKTTQEKENAKKDAEKDYQEDLKKIKQFKGDRKAYRYQEKQNKWGKRGGDKKV